jgi:carbon monoxide dehydrogenase subunit G
MHALLLAAALAAEPNAWIADDGTVVGVASVAAPPSAVMQVLRDPQLLSSIAASGTRIQVVGPDGACTVLDYTSPSVLSDIRYRVRQCPKGDGVEATLVASDSFSAYRTRWTVTPEGAGSLLRYDLAMTVKLLVPSSLVNQTSRRAVRQMLDQLVAHFGP